MAPTGGSTSLKAEDSLDTNLAADGIVAPHTVVKHEVMEEPEADSGPPSYRALRVSLQCCGGD